MTGRNGAAVFSQELITTASKTFPKKCGPEIVQGFCWRVRASVTAEEASNACGGGAAVTIKRSNHVTKIEFPDLVRVTNLATGHVNAFIQEAYRIWECGKTPPISFYCARCH